ncbi:Ig-like domain-containing protein [Gemmatimonadota bacterium DH-20]|uniref:Ig-like domain-containing protein n=1 Tax=Gaopeijia maritima TaxID=3119007 RepID=A0ABU9E3W6_9BACT
MWFRSSAFVLLGLFSAACTDNGTPSQLTGVEPGDRFENVAPDQVSDLSALSLNHRAVELSWTQVQDGKGLPAQYQVRVVDGPGGWEQGTVVNLGSCEYPVRGAAIGTTLTCVVDGLQAERDYQFLVGAERSDLSGVVAGSPSRAMAAATREAPRVLIPTEAEVVSGLQYAGTVGQALQKQIEVVLRDSLGAPIPGVPVMWASGAGGGATAGPMSVSDAAGRVRTVWTLGPQAGTQTLGVRVDGMQETLLVAEAAAGPVDQIRLTVDTVTMGVGDEASVVVQGWDEFGNEVDDLPVEWATSNSEIVAVNANGVIRSEGWGWVRIRAWVQDRWRKTKTEDSTTVVVEADPGNISDLRLESVGEDWLALAWGEVDDGTGNAASYETRVGSAGAGWSQASVVSEGTCASTGGSAIGARRNCTVAGLDDDTRYDVLVRAFRVKDGSRVYGATASASGSTLAAPVVPAGVAAESGANQAGTVGAPLPSPVVVRVVDASGGPVPGTPVTFVPSDGGAVSDSRVVTDAQGRASVQWTLGTRVGLQSLMTTVEEPSGVSGPSMVMHSTEPVTISATANAGAATQLSISPASLTLQDGGTGSLSVRAFDAFGNVTASGGVQWTSADAQVATVSSNGGVAAVAEGQTTVTARLGDVAANATVTVEGGDEPPADQDPARLSDVRVVSTTESSLVVEYTQVDDGTGNPAISEIRHALSPMGWGWGTATVLQSGNCASPILGSSVGATRRCVIEGLNPGTTYDVQMVSWRIDGGTNTYAPLSNVASGRTTEVEVPQGPAVAEVVTSPASFTLDEVGRTYPLVAVAYDSNDNVVSTPFTWTSSNPAVATVSANGTVRAMGSGTAMIIATALCCAEADTSIVTVSQVQTPPIGVGEPWHFEDWSYSGTAAMFGSGRVTNETHGGGDVELLQNLSGTPGGFTRAVRMRFDANSGREPQVGVGITLPDADRDQPREVWVEFYARWSSNWTTNGPYEGNPDHKFFFLFDQTPSGARRWESNIGVYGDAIGTYIAGNGLNEQHPAGIQSLWDGNWHRFRYHARMDRSGVWEVEIDGQTFRWSGGNTDFGSQYYFKYLALSRNLNRGTNRTMTLDYGPVAVYTANPGW